MLCDRAVAMPLPRGDRFPPYTLSKAMPAGWMWRIPLGSRIGNGYVYSSAHASADAAIAALIGQSGLRKERAANPRLIKIRVGRRTNFWLRNCVSVGLSSGFVEPLESTGIHMIQKAVMLLLAYWPDRDFSDALRAAYNRQMADLLDEVRDFIVLHYVLAQRGEPFWREARNAPLPDSLREKLALYDETGRIETAKRQLFPETSYLHSDRQWPIPATADRRGRRRQSGEVWQLLDRIRAENRDFVARAASHKTYLDELHRTPM